ncbi:MAG TPA: RodZ domain-containing protein [Streptosporangiaceae bacterium]|nr:RodZ domain-containing protein [Streptosporangiaceae bacterium]
MTDGGTNLSVGEALAAARRQAGLTITQVSQRTCIRETIVRGIERGDYSACGGDFYARGHVRSIARAVGLDPDQVVQQYDMTQKPSAPITAADVFQPFTPVKLKERRRPNWTIVLLAGIVVVAGIVGFRYFAHSNPPRPSASSHHSHHHAAAPAASPSAAPVAAQSTATHVQVTIIAHPGNVTWAQLTADNGKVLFSGDIGTGSGLTQQTETTTVGMRIELGNPLGADLYVNGKKVPTGQTHPISVFCNKTTCV